MIMENLKNSQSFDLNLDSGESNDQLEHNNNSCNTIAEEQISALQTNFSRYSDIFQLNSKSNSEVIDDKYKETPKKLPSDEKFVEIKLWEESRIEKYQQFIGMIDPIFQELSDSISQAIQTNKDLATILQQKTKLWTHYYKSLEFQSTYNIKNSYGIGTGIPITPPHSNLNPASLPCSCTSTCSCSYNAAQLPVNVDFSHSKSSELSNYQNSTNAELTDKKEDNPLNPSFTNVNNPGISRYLFKSILNQKIWPNFLINFEKYESTFLRKLSQSIETDVVNGHLTWISKRYLNNAQGFLKVLRTARKEFETFIINTQQSWNKYDEAYKNSQRLSLDVNYSLKSKPCDTWYFDQLYRHNINKFIQAQTKFFNTLLITIDNLVELENWRATSVKLTLNYFLIKQNEFFEFLQKVGKSIIDHVNNEFKYSQNSLLQEYNSKFDIITSIPGLRPPPIPISIPVSNSTESDLIESSKSLENCPTLQSVLPLINYSTLPKSQLITYHGHVEIFKRKMFLGQWQSAYLVLTKDRFLYLLSPKDDIEMEELLKYDEKPIWMICIASSEMTIENNEKRGKRCFSLRFKLKIQNLFTRKITIRCPNEDECSKWIKHLNSGISPN
ncbi:PH domain-containing protein [Cryptosporidium felis]|nr:PH domain-containing protein [Cryptosporidium felis]